MSNQLHKTIQDQIRRNYLDYLRALKRNGDHPENRAKISLLNDLVSNVEQDFCHLDCYIIAHNLKEIGETNVTENPA